MRGSTGMDDPSGYTTRHGKKAVKTSIEKPDRESGPLAAEWLEYHRNAIALVPSAEDASPGVAIMVIGAHGDTAYRSCTCSRWASQTCRHMLRLSSTYKAHRSVLGWPDLGGSFRNSLWYEIAAVLAEGCRDTPHTVKVKRVPRDPAIYVYDTRGKLLCTYLTTGSDSVRFCERCCEALETGSAFSRSDILNQLSRLTLTETERVVMARGLQTRRQALEQSFWYRMAYHGFRELGDQCTMHTGVDSQDHFRITALDARQAPVFSAFIAPEKVRRIIGLLAVPGT